MQVLSYLLRHGLVIVVPLWLAGCGGGGGGGMDTGPGSIRAPLIPPPAESGGAGGGGAGGGGGATVGGPGPNSAPGQSAPSGPQVIDYGSGLIRYADSATTHVLLLPPGASFDPNQTGLEIDASTLAVLQEWSDGALYQAEGLDHGGQQVVAALYRHAASDGCTTTTCEGPTMVYLRPIDGSPGTLQAFGPTASNLPQGRFSYAGQTWLKVADSRGLQQGTFDLQVNFDTARASMTAQTADFSVAGDGLVVDLTTGALSGGALQITGFGGGVVSARLQGNLHGDGATGVSGIFHENAATPRLTGALAGGRVP